MTRDEIVQYWLNSAETDLAAMETLFRSGHFVWALFLGHLVLEKTLKANYVCRVPRCFPMYVPDCLLGEGGGIGPGSGIP